MMIKLRKLALVALTVVLLALPLSSANAFFGMMRGCCGGWGGGPWYGYPYSGYGYPYWGGYYPYYGGYGYPHYGHRYGGYPYYW